MKGILSTSCADFILDDMIRNSYQLLMIFWDKRGISVGRMIFREQNIEQALEIASANETNITDFYGIVLAPGSGSHKALP